MKTEISTYEKQALDFLAKTNTGFTAEFVRHGKHFDNDKDTRDIYSVTLKRGNRSFTFEFGQSVMASGEYQVREGLRNKLWCEQVTGGKYALTAKEFKATFKPMDFVASKDIAKNPNYSAPTPYDVLACLTKYDPGTFEDFCGEFGYDTDSKSAEKTYNAVVNEWKNVQSLFSDAEIEELQEIQ